MDVRVVGVDCATLDAKTGIALGDVSSAGVSVRDVRLCTEKETAATRVAAWLTEEPERPVLLAIDAPLGWPRELTIALANHRAGGRIPSLPDKMFRRSTDEFVRRKLRKTPLDVGADRIARTAHAALKLLENIANDLHRPPIPLAWSPDWHGVAAIEVYPAATLLAHKFQASGYKRRTQTSERESIRESLQGLMKLPPACQLIVESADALDAVVCVLAGYDFIRGQVNHPQDRALAEQEGWIWFYDDRGAA